MSKEDKGARLRKNPLLPIVQDALERLDSILQVMTEPHTEFPAAENSEWVQGYLQFNHTLEEHGLFETHVLKVQAPQYSSEENPPCLVYNQDKTIMTDTPYDESMLMWLEGKPKVYIESRIWADGSMQFVRIIEDKEW